MTYILSLYTIRVWSLLGVDLQAPKRFYPDYVGDRDGDTCEQGDEWWFSACHHPAHTPRFCIWLMMGNYDIPRGSPGGHPHHHGATSPWRYAFSCFIQNMGTCKFLNMESTICQSWNTLTCTNEYMRNWYERQLNNFGLGSTRELLQALVVLDYGYFRNLEVGGD